MILDGAIFPGDNTTIEQQVATILKAFSMQNGDLQSLIASGNKINISVSPVEDFITIEASIN